MAARDVRRPELGTEPVGPVELVERGDRSLRVISDQRAHDAVADRHADGRTATDDRKVVPQLLVVVPEVSVQAALTLRALLVSSSSASASPNSAMAKAT